MRDEDVLATFRRWGALLDGHFILSSGRHSPGYLQCALVLQYPDEAEALAKALAPLVSVFGARAVLSPALGGVVIGQELARALGIRALFAERQDGTLSLRRGFSFGPGEPVLIVEDVLTTGGSTRETMEVAAAAGAKVVGACAIIDRSGGHHNLDVPFQALAVMKIPTYEPDSCPMCVLGLPITKPGSRQ